MQDFKLFAVQGRCLVFGDKGRFCGNHPIAAHGIDEHRFGVPAREAGEPGSHNLIERTCFAHPVAPVAQRFTDRIEHNQYLIIFQYGHSHRKRRVGIILAGFNLKFLMVVTEYTAFYRIGYLVYILAAHTEQRPDSEFAPKCKQAGPVYCPAGFLQFVSFGCREPVQHFMKTQGQPGMDDKLVEVQITCFTDQPLPRLSPAGYPDRFQLLFQVKNQGRVGVGIDGVGLF